MVKIILAALAALLISSSAAFAQCEVKGYSIFFGSDTSFMLYAGSGETCGASIGGRGNSIDSIKITSPPKNGVARIANLSTFGYRSKPGFHGKDQFVIHMVGSTSNPITHGASDVTVDVTVE